MSEDCCQLFKNLCQPESMKFYRARSYTCHEFFSLCSVKSKCTCICISIYFDLCSMKLQISKLPNFHRLLGRSSCPKPLSQYQLSEMLRYQLILLLFGPNNAVRNIRTIRTVNPTKYIIFLSCLTPHILLNITQVLRVQYCRFQHVLVVNRGTGKVGRGRL